MRIDQIALAACGLTLQLILCGVLIWRRHYRAYPTFTAYTLFSTIATVVLFAFLQRTATYFWSFWTVEAVSVLLGLGCLFESFEQVFVNFRSIPGFRYLFPGISIVMATIASIRVFAVHMPEKPFLTALIVSLEIGLRLLQFGIFLLFLALIRLLRLQWQVAFGVVMGFGVLASLNLGVNLLRSEFGTKSEFVASFMPQLDYIIAVIIWLATFARRDAKAKIEDLLQPDQMFELVTRYRAAAKEILKR